MIDCHSYLLAGSFLTDYNTMKWVWYLFGKMKKNNCQKVNHRQQLKSQAAIIWSEQQQTRIIYKSKMKILSKVNTKKINTYNEWHFCNETICKDKPIKGWIYNRCKHMVIDLVWLKKKVEKRYA